MDIYFNNNESSQSFLWSLNLHNTRYNGTMYISDCILYSFDQNFIHKKINIYYRIGKTFCNNGYRIKIDIDMLINNNINLNIEPPFNNADFSCNIFIMSKIAMNKYEIRLSRNTGTKLDKMSIVDKTKITTDILTNLINGKTEFIRNIQSDDSEYMNGMRILKMLNNPFIKITNLLFKEIDYEKIDNICDICQCSFMEDDKKNQPLIKIMTNKHAPNLMHKSCFVQYLSNEIYKKNTNPTTNEIECRCTRRNLFNFKKSYKYSSLYL